MMRSRKLTICFAALAVLSVFCRIDSVGTPIRLTAQEVWSAHSKTTADKIWLQPIDATSTQGNWYPRAIEIKSGRIVSFDADSLRLIVQGQEVETIVAAKRVIWIEPGNVSEAEANVFKNFIAGKTAEGLSGLAEVLQSRPPVWRQQWLTMLGASAAWKNSRPKLALELVSQLDQRPLPPLVMAWLPIQWTNDQPSAAALEVAKERLDDTSLATRLVAASWLLSSSDRSRAIAILRQLPSSDQPIISSLSEGVLWRTATPPQVLEAADRWHAELEAMPMVLQTGPSIALRHKLQAAGQTEASNRLRWSQELIPVHP